MVLYCSGQPAHAAIKLWRTENPEGECLYPRPHKPEGETNPRTHKPEGEAPIIPITKENPNTSATLPLVMARRGS